MPSLAILVSAVLVLLCGQTDRITEVDECYAHGTTVDVSNMRSPYIQILTVPRHNLSFGSRAFRISAPKNWNTLPLEVRQSHSLPTFRNRLKTFCFRSAYPSS